MPSTTSGLEMTLISLAVRVPPHSDKPKELSEAARVRQRKIKYMKSDRTMERLTLPKGKDLQMNEVEVGSPMYNFINPHPVFSC